VTLWAQVRTAAPDKQASQAISGGTFTLVGSLDSRASNGEFSTPDADVLGDRQERQF
jgi:hypothetical protein